MPAVIRIRFHTVHGEFEDEAARGYLHLGWPAHL